MASLQQIVFCSMIILIISFAGILIIILTLIFTGNISYVLSSDKTPVANLGGNQLLSCYLDTHHSKITRLSVVWTKAGLNGDVYRFQGGSSDLKNQDPQFKGRTQLVSEGLVVGNGSLLLTAVKAEDQGEYTCSIWSSVGGGSVSLQLSTGAFSAPNFTLQKSTLLAVADRWLPQPNVTWSDHTGTKLTGTTSFTPNSAGIYRVQSSLAPVNNSDTYRLTIQNDLKIVVSEATITDSGVTQKTYYSDINKASSLQPATQLNFIITLFIGLTTGLHQ